MTAGEAQARETASDAAIQRVLRAARRHLGLETGFISQFVGDRRVVRFVDHDEREPPVGLGDIDPRTETYCHYVAAGELPEFLRDPATHPVAGSLEITQSLPIGTHASVPIRFSDGRVYGTFCCFSRRVDTEVKPDLKVMRALADVASEVLEELDDREREKRRQREWVEQIIESDSALQLNFQPLVDLMTMQLVGVEVLSRFPGHAAGPHEVFELAHHVGLGLELEMRVVRDAIAVLPEIPPPLRLNVNVSPSTLVAPEFFPAVAGVPRERLVVEVTEHAAVLDYVELRDVSRRLSELGVWLSIDDVGMGFSGLNQILEIRPDELKLDRVVIRDIDSDVVREALFEGLCWFGVKVGVHMLAEGIETVGELTTVQRLGAAMGQGYFLARPAPLAAALARHDFSSLADGAAASA